jgi:threonine/homoserine/homoserine lactone efflux protein
VVPQLVLLALVAMAIDVVIGSIYILTGNGLARAMNRATTRTWVNRTVGTIFLVIAVFILADLVLR